MKLKMRVGFTSVALGLGIALVGVGAPADARVSPGDITLTVTGKCTAPGDSIKRLSIWTPEKGHKQVTPKKGAQKSATINLGKFRKTVTGNTYFNYNVDCWKSGNSGSKQKKYGGSVGGVNYSYTFTNLYGKILGI
ncbi:hypothetical protein [Paeniglutamicibacter gangotriensis]|nr:hypothetical protein [Paeniglutamicibacter gangotriensis]